MLLRVTNIDWSHRVVTSEGGEPQLATNTRDLLDSSAERCAHNWQLLLRILYPTEKLQVK